MKKIFLFALLVLLFSCSNDSFEKPKEIKLPDGSLFDVSETETIVNCVKEEGESKFCYEISKSACGIIGGTVDSTEACINFACKWDQDVVKYGRSSTLSFDLDNAGHENCSGKIFYGNRELSIGSHIISSSDFPGLSYSKDTSIIARATVTCGEKKYNRNCSALKVNSVVAPNVKCNWSPNKVNYGENSTLSFAFDPQSVADEEACTLKKIFYVNKELSIGSNVISSSILPGLSPSKDTSVVVKATVACGVQDKWEYEQPCGELEIDSVPSPKWNGELSFKKSDYGKDTSYFFIGTKIDTSYIKSTIQVTNKDLAKCDDNIIIKIEGSPAKENTPVKATAVIYCKYTDTLELASISAKVLPDPVIGDCELTKNSKTTMRSNDTLTIGISVNNSYDRCSKIEYKINGADYTTSNSFPLSTSGNKTLDSVYARVTCGTATPVTKKCPTVTVATYLKWDDCKESKRDDRTQLTFKSGKTIVSFACDTKKEDYYISCNGDRGNFSIEIEGYKEGDSEDDIRPNGGDNGYNFPNLDATKEGNLYRYPVPIIVNSKATGDLKCGIW